MCESLEVAHVCNSTVMIWQKLPVKPYQPPVGRLSFKRITLWNQSSEEMGAFLGKQNFPNYLKVISQNH